MVAEIISVGTELLLGSTVDSDSAYLGRTLAALGIDLFFKQPLVTTWIARSRRCGWGRRARS